MGVSQDLKVELTLNSWENFPLWLRIIHVLSICLFRLETHMNDENEQNVMRGAMTPCGLPLDVDSKWNTN